MSDGEDIDSNLPGSSDPDEADENVDAGAPNGAVTEPASAALVDVRPKRKNLTPAQYREKLFGDPSKQKVYVVIGDKLRQVRHVLDSWGWVENQPTNGDDRLVFDLCWAGRALRVDGLFGYLPQAQCVNHFRGSGQFDSKAGMLLSLRTCAKGCLHEFYPPSYDLRSASELEGFLCDAFFHRLVSQRHTKAAKSVLRRLMEKRTALIAALKEQANPTSPGRKVGKKSLASAILAAACLEAEGMTLPANNGSAATSAAASKEKAGGPLPTPNSNSSPSLKSKSPTTKTSKKYSEDLAGIPDDKRPPLVPLKEGVNPRPVSGIEACLHEYCSLFEQAQRGPVDDIPTYLEATSRPWMTTYLESCIDNCGTCVTEHDLRIEKGQALGARVCVFGKAVAPVDRHGNTLAGYSAVELSNAAKVIRGSSSSNDLAFSLPANSCSAGGNSNALNSNSYGSLQNLDSPNARRGSGSLLDPGGMSPDGRAGQAGGESRSPKRRHSSSSADIPGMSFGTAARDLMGLGQSERFSNCAGASPSPTAKKGKLAEKLRAAAEVGKALKRNSSSGLDVRIKRDSKAGVGEIDAKSDVADTASVVSSVSTAVFDVNKASGESPSRGGKKLKKSKSKSHSGTGTTSPKKKKSKKGKKSKKSSKSKSGRGEKVIDENGEAVTVEGTAANSEEDGEDDDGTSSSSDGEDEGEAAAGEKGEDAESRDPAALAHAQQTQSTKADRRSVYSRSRLFAAPPDATEVENYPLNAVRAHIRASYSKASPTSGEREVLREDEGERESKVGAASPGGPDRDTSSPEDEIDNEEEADAVTDEEDEREDEYEDFMLPPPLEDVGIKATAGTTAAANSDADSYSSKKCIVRRIFYERPPPFLARFGRFLA
eukprot:g15232.t1